MSPSSSFSQKKDIFFPPPKRTLSEFSSDFCLEALIKTRCNSSAQTKLPKNKQLEIQEKKKKEVRCRKCSIEYLLDFDEDLQFGAEIQTGPEGGKKERLHTHKHLEWDNTRVALSV